MTDLEKEIERLKGFELAYKEWESKTAWIRELFSQGKMPSKLLGMHRADIMRVEIERLQALLDAKRDKQTAELRAPQAGSGLVKSDAMQRFIEEAAAKRASLMESFVLVYLRETKLSITDVEMVERTEGSNIIWYLRKKGSEN